MKHFVREDTHFSLCGLNCDLCSMHIANYCPGCGGGPGNQPCAIARCGVNHGGIEYCHQCAQHPCEKYIGIDQFDSFITHRNQLKDIDKFKRIGKVAYLSELKEKVEILKYLLANYNDGRKKSFYCIAINLLELSDIKSIMQQLEVETCGKELAIKEKATIATNLFQSVATQRNIVLKLNKKSIDK